MGAGPSTFDVLTTAAASATSYTDLQTVRDYQTEVYQAMISADTAVQNNQAALAPTDYQQWSGAIVSFLQWYATLQDCEGETLPSWHPQCDTYYSLLSGGWSGAYNRLAAFAKQANAAQAMVAAAVPSYKPPDPVLPPPPPPPPLPGPTDILSSIATAAKAIGVLLLVGVGAYFLFEIISVGAGAAKAAPKAPRATERPALWGRGRRRPRSRRARAEEWWGDPEGHSRAAYLGWDHHRESEERVANNIPSD
jgi:hypothetical protein